MEVHWTWILQKPVATLSNGWIFAFMLVIYTHLYINSVIKFKIYFAVSMLIEICTPHFAFFFEVSALLIWSTYDFIIWNLVISAYADKLLVLQIEMRCNMPSVRLQHLFDCYQLQNWMLVELCRISMYLVPFCTLWPITFMRIIIMH